jgi:ABC-type uncharacterized transport system permease subunit
MIRNYYTDSYKTGIPVVASDVNLLDGRAKASTPQAYWEQYNLYIGRAATAPATTAVVTPATTTSITISWVIPNPNIMAGMTISGTGVPAGIIVVSVAAGGLSIVASAPLTLTDLTVLTFSFATLNTLKVLTVDNQDVTFNNLQPGTILPVSVVQVYSTGTLGVDNMTALH